MSSRTAIAPISRAFAAPIRASPIAGPSRIPLPTLRRSLQTDADTSKTSAEHHGTSKLAVRTSQPLTSVLQAYAVLRSVESTYGQVIDFDMSRDVDSLQPTNMLFFTLAEPVNLNINRDVLHEIPSPKSSEGVMERYGGPSLNDIRNILREPSLRLTSSSRGKSSQTSITFKVEARRRSGNTPPLTLRRSTPTMIRQDRKILEALGKFGDGFFGGFKGLQETHSAIVDKKERSIKGFKGKQDHQESADNAAEVDADAEETLPESEAEAAAEVQLEGKA